MKITESLFINNFFSEVEDPLSQQAFEQDGNYRDYELSRLTFRKQIKNTIRAIKFPLGISPTKLRDGLLKQQENLELNIISPLNYYFYLERLELVLYKNYGLLKGYQYALSEARARLLEKLKENPEVAFNYFYQDVFNHVVRSSAISLSKKLFKALSEGGKVEMELQEMFWGDYFGSCSDTYGVAWMFNCSSKA